MMRQFDKPNPNRFNRQKLILSKWTAVTPENREKHFLVTELCSDEDAKNPVCILEAVLTRTEYRIDCRDLADPGRWLSGWR